MHATKHLRFSVCGLQIDMLYKIDVHTSITIEKNNSRSTWKTMHMLDKDTKSGGHDNGTQMVAHEKYFIKTQKMRQALAEHWVNEVQLLSLEQPVGVCDE